MCSFYIFNGSIFVEQTNVGISHIFSFSPFHFQSNKQANDRVFFANIYVQIFVLFSLPIN